MDTSAWSRAFLSSGRGCAGLFRPSQASRASRPGTIVHAGLYFNILASGLAAGEIDKIHLHSNRTGIPVCQGCCPMALHLKYGRVLVDAVNHLKAFKYELYYKDMFSQFLTLKKGLKQSCGIRK
jgi:hypothetical protein